MIDLSLSSDEENFIANTSCDAEFTKKLFGDLNSDILESLGDDNVIVLDDSNEEKETHEEKTVNTEPAATSAAVNPASIASTDTDDAPTGAKNDNSDDHRPDQEAGDDNSNGDGTDEPYTAALKIKVLRQTCLKDAHCSALLFFHLLCARELRW
jgi:hypothetical protein